MFFFNRRVKLINSDLFKGFTDHHSHILPSVDDGVDEMCRSLEALDYFESLGITKVYLTPHVMSDVRVTPEALDRRFEELKEQYKGGIELVLAAEYMLDNGYSGHLKSGLRTMYAENALVETSYVSPPANMSVLLYDTISSGIRPIIAHPERYVYMDIPDYNALKSNGYALQFNMLSLSGFYGLNVVRKAEYLLDNKMYDYIGSDLHDLSVFQRWIEKVKLTTKQLDFLNSLKQG